MPTLNQQETERSLFSFSPWAYWLDFLVYALLSGLLLLLLLVKTPMAQALATTSWVLVGAVAWTAIEYVLHRFVLHGLPPFKAWHAEHHKEPRALMGAPTWLSLSLFGLGAALPAWAFLPLDGALALLLGLLLGYLAYIGTHHGVHHLGGLDAEWLRRRLRWHARHHGRGGSRRQLGHFGVTTALWDRLFKTGGRATRRPAAPINEALAPVQSPELPPGG